MATVPGPPVTLASVRSVFGAPAGTPLHAFVRGGAYVPNISQNNNVPTAPPIRLAQLAGATNYQAPVINGPNSLSMAPLVSSVSGTWSMSGGTGNVTSILWTKTANTGEAINITSTTTLSPTFTRTHNNTEGDSTWDLAISDGVTTVHKSVNVTGASNN